MLTSRTLITQGEVETNNKPEKSLEVEKEKKRKEKRLIITTLRVSLAHQFELKILSSNPA